jgi:dipeptidase
MRKAMMKMLSLAGMLLLLPQAGQTCTNFLISKGATVDGSTMITYVADSHTLFGELYYLPAADYPEGSMLDVYEWDTGKFLGRIRQVRHTYSVIGNMNEYQVAIGETTYGGRGELADPTAIMDYGSLMFIALQRSKSAREAIRVMSDLVTEYGYCSEGESFSVSDANEVWIMELIGKGPGNKGMIFVARRVPDGYVSGHANHPRITTFPQDGPTSISTKSLDKIFNPEVENVYAYDVIDVARNNGWFSGEDKDFSFSDTYAPVDFGAARQCEARVFTGFNKVSSGMDKYLDYAMGINLKNRMPLWVKVDKKLTVRDVMGMMRDYFQNTPMDMTKDIGAGPYQCIVRWRPMAWKVDGQSYFNERAISTQQTGFSFIAQGRGWLPNPIGGIFWFGVDDTYTTVYTPMYCGMTSVPQSYAVGNGSMMVFNENAAFWVFNQVSNFAYTRYKDMIRDIQPVQDKLELGYIEKVKEVDKTATELYKKSPKKAIKYITRFSVDAGNGTVNEWKNLYAFLFTKYLDGNIKTARPVPPGYKFMNPDYKQPGYSEEWYRMVAKETGDKFKIPDSAGH